MKKKFIDASIGRLIGLFDLSSDEHNDFMIVRDAIRDGRKREREMLRDLSLACIHHSWKKQDGKCYFVNIKSGAECNRRNCPMMKGLK